MLKDKLLPDIDKYLTEDYFVEFAEQAIELFPPYFEVAPASTSGLFHPVDERGEGGLLLHTRRMMWACDQLARALTITDDMRNCFIVAGMLHDSKSKVVDESGNVMCTGEFHELIPRKHFKELETIIGAENYDLIMTLVESHSGIWSPTPRLIPDEDELLLWAFHLADYMISRKEVIINLEG